jgi:hypothetical protein
MMTRLSSSSPQEHSRLASSSFLHQLSLSLSHLSERICRSAALRFSSLLDNRPAILQLGFRQLPTAEKQNIPQCQATVILTGFPSLIPLCSYSQKMLP